MKRKKGDTVYKITARVFLTVALILLALPLFIMFRRSFERVGLLNYVDVISNIRIGRSLLNSLYVVGLTIVLTVCVCSLAAYAFSKLQFRGKNILFIILLMGIMVPGSATLFPVFQITKAVGLMDKLTGLIGPYVTGNSIFGLLMLKIYYDSLPNELMEAAIIDGASSGQIFRKVYFPLSKAGLSILLINTFNGAWNELMTCITLINDKEKYTMSVLPYKYKLEVMANAMDTTQWPKIFACMILCMIPIVIFYSFAQSLIFNGVSAGAVKG